MKLSKKERFRIGEQAALRLLRSKEDDSHDTRADFLEWTRVSSHHVHEMLFMQAVSEELKGMDPNGTIDVDSLPTLPEVGASVHEYEPLAERADAASNASAGGTRRHRWHWIGGMAAACAGLVFAGWLILGSGGHTYRTGLGEQRSVKLSDGSVMVLNTGSHAEVHFTQEARDIRLLEGEALFVVEHDKTRPFRVSTDGGTITAVGTRFNVDRHAGDTRVAVVEGVVRISAATAPAAQTGAGAIVPPASSLGGEQAESPKSSRKPENASVLRLAAGDEALIGHGQVVKAERPDVERAIAWRTRQLIFRGTPIADVAAEFNRYNRTQIRIEGDELRGQNLGGVFDADDVQTLVDFLEDDPRFTITRGQGEIVIRPRESGSAVPRP